MFNIALAEGPVFQQGAQLYIQSEPKPRSFADLLNPFLGQQINIAFHFMPPDGLDENKWGYGSCLWQERGLPCPVGHHKPEHRLRMLSVKAEGVFQVDGAIWAIRQFDGQIKKLPLPLLEGHHSRIVVAPVVDVEKMREALSTVDASKIEVLGQQAEQLKGVLQNIKKAASALPKVTPGGENG